MSKTCLGTMFELLYSVVLAAFDIKDEVFLISFNIERLLLLALPCLLVEGIILHTNSK